MANMATDGHGTTLTYGTLTANVLSVDGPSMSRDPIDAFYMATDTWHEFIPADLTDPGTLSVEFEFDSGEDPTDDMNGPLSALTIHYAGSGTWVSSAFVTEWSTGAAIGERMTANATFKLSGGITVTTA